MERFVVGIDGSPGRVVGGVDGYASGPVVVVPG